MTLGQAIIRTLAAREGIDLSKRGAVTQLGVSHNIATRTVRAWLRGEGNPPADRAAELAEIHGLHITLTPDGWTVTDPETP